MEKMGKEELRNPNLVVAWLKQGLGESDGRWLLCLQNADDSKVNGILNEVCGIAGEAKEKGWVVVTLRQGRPHIQGVQKKPPILNGPLFYLKEQGQSVLLCYNMLT